MDLMNIRVRCNLTYDGYWALTFSWCGLCCLSLHLVRCHVALPPSCLSFCCWLPSSFFFFFIHPYITTRLLSLLGAFGSTCFLSLLRCRSFVVSFCCRLRGRWRLGRGRCGVWCLWLWGEEQHLALLLLRKELELITQTHTPVKSRGVIRPRLLINTHTKNLFLLHYIHTCGWWTLSSSADLHPPWIPAGWKTSQQ